MNRVRGYTGAVSLLAAFGLLGCGSNVDGSATAPLATLDTDPPSVVRTAPPVDRTTTSSTTARTATSTLPTTTTAAPLTADASQYQSGDGFLYFASPTGKFECGVFVTNSSVAGCHGEFPPSVPKVEGSGAPNSSVAPNTVELTAGSPAKFLSSGDPRFHRFDGTARALPYGSILAVSGSGSSNGVECRIDESSGVTCLDQVGHGFTVSDTAFELK